MYNELLHLRIRAGNFSGYFRKFNTLRSQLNPALVEPAPTFAFTHGLILDFKQEILYVRAAKLQMAIDRAVFSALPFGLELSLPRVVLSFWRTRGTCHFIFSAPGFRVLLLLTLLLIPILTCGGVLYLHVLCLVPPYGPSRTFSTAQQLVGDKCRATCYKCGSGGHYATICHSGPSTVRSSAPQSTGPPRASSHGRSDSNSRSTLSTGRSREQSSLKKGGRSEGGLLLNSPGIAIIGGNLCSFG